MHASEILQIWECSHRGSLTAAAVAMLARAHPDMSPESCDALPIGARDQALLRLRERIFGPHLVCRADCPDCGDPLEFDTTTATLRIGAATPGEHVVERGDVRVALRPPGSGDVAAAAADPDAHRSLLRRCVIAVWRGGEACSIEQVDPEMWDALGAALTELDPGADLRFALACPSCRREWSAPFDIVAILRDELTAFATRTLRDVDTLARAYGWREADILALSPLRRRLYLDLLSS